jgi:hypothetical protein
MIALFFPMLEIILLFALYGLLQKVFVDCPAKRRMKHLLATDEALLLRRKTRHRRRILFGLFLLSLFLGLGSCSLLLDWNTGQVDPVHWKWVLTFPALLWAYLHGGKNTERILGRISLQNKATFLAEHPRFSLYLRGFAQDDYTPEGKLDRLALKRKPLRHFSEYLFVKTLAQHSPVCAIGMTREIDTPIGAERIYVDDETWRNDVSELMEKSDSIFILINDSPSCVWEILASRNWLQKTVFIVNDIRKYQTAHAAAARDGFLLPAPTGIPSPAKGTILAIKNDHGVFSCCSFDNSLRDYAAFLGVPPLSKRLFKRHEGWGCLGVFWFSLLLLFPVFWMNQDREFEEQLSFRSTISDYKTSQGIDGELSVQTTSGELLFVPPERSEAISPDSQLYQTLSQAEAPGFSREAIYACPAGNALSDEFLVVSSCPIWSNVTFSSLSFKLRMQAEKKELPIGKTIAEHLQHDCDVGEIHCAEYDCQTTVVAVGNATREHFAWSNLREERLDTMDARQFFFTLIACRFIRIGHKALLLSASQTFPTQETARAQIQRLEKDLACWEKVIRAVNSLKPLSQKSHHGNPATVSTEPGNGNGVSAMIPLLLFSLSIFVLWKKV